MNNNHVPPSNIEAEEAVLSAAILDASARDEAMAVLSPEHFYTDAHQSIWRAVVDLQEANQPVDIVTLTNRLRDGGQLDRVGGTPALLKILDSTPAIVHVEEHARIVRDKWRSRQLISHCQKTTAEAYAGESVEQLLADHTLALDAVSVSRSTDTQSTVHDALRKEVEAYNYRASRQGYVPGIPTGLTELDERIGGLARSVPYVLAGRPGMGKTGCAISLAVNVASTGYGVVMLSLEQPREQVVRRIAAQLAMVSIKDIREGRLSATDMPVYSGAIVKASKLPIVIDDNAKQTPMSIRSATRRALRTLQREYDVKSLGLIIVDYLQLMEAKAATREQEVKAASEACRLLAKEFRCPVLVLSQLNREVEKRPDKRPTLADLRDSGTIEQDAFGIFLLYRADKYRKHGEASDGQVEINVAKLREGGEEGRVQCKFHGPSSRFYDLTTYSPQRNFYDED